MTLDRLAARLGQLRRHRAAVWAHPATRSTVTERYDRLLIATGKMLELPVPALARGGAILDESDRAELEQALAEAGFDVRPTLEGTAG